MRTVLALLVVAVAVGWVAPSYAASPKCDRKIPTIVGTPGNDTIVGTTGADVILAGAGNDLIRGGRGEDAICAGPGADVVRGSWGMDFIFGGLGADDLFGEQGGDFLFDGAGNDVLYGGPGIDDLQTRRGHDKAFGGRGTDGFADNNATRDSLYGGPGADTFWVWAQLGTNVDGPNVYQGGEGRDEIIVRLRVHPVVVDLTLGLITLGGVTQSALFGFEDATAFLGDAVLIGDEGPNTLDSGEENDHLEGRGGDDRLLAGRGTDLLDGGDGLDECVDGETLLNCETVNYTHTSLRQLTPVAATYPTGAFSGSGDGVVQGQVIPVDINLVPPRASTSGCEAADFVGIDWSGPSNIALIQRGTCSYGMKAINAQTAGAEAVIIFNQGDTPLREMLNVGILPPDGAAVTIPVVGASFADGAALAQPGSTAFIVAVEE